MELIYDNDADALEITLGPGIVCRTIQIDAGTLVDVDEHGDVVALELIRPMRPWPLDEIFARFQIAERDADQLRAMQADSDRARTGALASPVFASILQTMPTTETQPDLLTLRELAAYLRVSMRTAYQLATDGSVPAVKVGGQWRIPRDELRRQLGTEEPRRPQPHSQLRPLLPNMQRP